VLGDLPELRKGTNKTYMIQDAAMGAFAVFFMQSASFLANQKAMQTREGRNNASSMFGLKHIPSDNQIRNLLDLLEAKLLFSGVCESGQRIGRKRGVGSISFVSKAASDHSGWDAILLVRRDPLRELFASYEREQTTYFHTVITPVIAAPGNARVIALEPEFIVPQDGYEKQDCERAAGKRWLEQHGSGYAELKATLLGDDLYCHQPFCEQVLEKKFNFIFVCKPDSHPEFVSNGRISAGPGSS